MRIIQGFVQLQVNSAEAEISLKHAAEALGATTLRYFKSEYEKAGAPYGLSMDGLKEWLIEQGHEGLVRRWESTPPRPEPR